MALEEYSLSLALAKRMDGLVIKDGSLKPIFEAKVKGAFFPGSGPLGLVKNIWDSPQQEIASNLVRDLSVGERSRAFLIEYGEIAYVSSYLRIAERAILRMDVAGRKGEIEFEDVFALFNRAASIIPEMTLEYYHRRYPENILPIRSLEEYLSAYFLSPQEIMAAVYY